MIKVLHKGEFEVREYTPEDFKSAMGAEYSPHLEFIDEKTLEKVKKKCEKAEKKGEIERRQKWMGTMYAKEIEQGYSPDLIIKWIDDTIGYGVFANEHIYPTSFVGEYTGVVRRKKIWADRKNNYCFIYPLSCFPKLVIDAEPKGNYTRFINHSSEPNLEPLSVFSGGVMHLILIAIAPIEKGTQLCYDYGPDYWAKRERAKPLREPHISRLVNA